MTGRFKPIRFLFPTIQTVNWEGSGLVKPLDIDEIWCNRIIHAVNGLEYGTVQIVVHDGRIVQIERTERKRFESDTTLRERSAEAKQSRNK
jgi:hypothetical protein